MPLKLKDRRCPHGNPPETRMQLDMIACAEPDCWDRVLRGAGYVRSKDADELVEAIEFILGEEPTFECPHGVWVGKDCEPDCIGNVLRRAITVARAIKVNASKRAEGRA